MVITDEAGAFIRAEMDKTGISTLRVLSSGRSCSCCGPGFIVKLGPAETNDRLCTVNGLEVAYEPHAVSFVESVTLDLLDNERGRRLVMRSEDRCAL
ncbi:adhesin [Saccharibacillus sp. CPCC 101409]|uniref:adhesin n=1 Tax=Saccharibacillus sp. CPCC 101409 TaxID=3058041 RepID=UPI002672B936|nr:adhesin [Saccharibacillus sp. CPCC 101409]MDO3412192.1 adhesin [Saccharibacillus sp. CPCC 101409]